MFINVCIVPCQMTKFNVELSYFRCHPVNLVLELADLFFKPCLFKFVHHLPFVIDCFVCLCFNINFLWFGFVVLLKNFKCGLTLKEGHFSYDCFKKIVVEIVARDQCLHNILTPFIIYLKLNVWIFSLSLLLIYC